MAEINRVRTGKRFLDICASIRSYRANLTLKVFLFEEENPSPRGGRPTKSYLLNEHQAVALAMWANTKEARQARIQNINVFVAWRQGNAYTLAQEAQKPDIFAQAAQRSSAVAAHLTNITEMEVLGYKEIGKIRTLIERNKSELNRYGQIIAQTEVLIGRGRPKVTNLLNEEQALLLCMFARTKRAADAREQIVNVFLAYRNGNAYTLAQEAQKPDIFTQAAQRSKLT